MFAADAGADHVYSCEMAEIAYDCIDIVRENNLQDKITVLKGKAEEQYEKIKDCDVIISEWMGYCLLFEGMLDSVIKVRGQLVIRRRIKSNASQKDIKLPSSHTQLVHNLWTISLSYLIERSY